MREPPGPLWGRAASLCVAMWGLAAVCAGGRRPAREIATREPAARSGRSRGPPWPCHRPPAPRPGPAGPAADSYRSAPRLEARPCPPAPSTPAVPAVLCVVARRLEARTGPAGPAAASYRSGLIAVSGQALLPPTGTAARPIGVVRIRWGFCAMRSLLLGFRRRVGGLDGVIPPLGGVGASVWNVVVAKVQTH